MRRLTKNSLALMAGMTAIIAQLVWVRYVTQLLGLSSLTIASVIGMSLLGLALGNLWGGRKLRSESQSKFAGLLLCGTGLAVLLMPAMFWLISSIDAAYFESPTAGGSTVEKLWILAVASPALVVHFLAGAVFPALLHAKDSTASTAGSIAAAETVGGCIGAALAGCLLMELWGMRLTLLICGTAAALVGGCVWRLSKAPAGEGDTHLTETNGAAGFKFSALVGLAVFLAGTASLGLEVIWQRVLILLVGTDAYSLTIVVVAYLIGMAVGAAVAAMWLKDDKISIASKWTSRVAVLQLAGALASVFVLCIALPHRAAVLGVYFLNHPFYFPAQLAGGFAFIGLVSGLYCNSRLR